MTFTELLNERRAFRSLESADITNDIIAKLANAASLAPSCYNHQPWRFVFVYEKNKLERMFESLSKGNAWARKASMIIAVFSERSMDCILPDERDYFKFDAGMGTAFMLLKAVELGLVAHPIAGYDEKMVKEILGIPEEFRVLTLIIVGKHGKINNEVLNEKQMETERKRPDRLPLEEFVFMNEYNSDITSTGY